MVRKSSNESATLYKIGTKKIGNDGNVWIIKSDKNGVNRWFIHKKNFSIKEKKDIRIIVTMTPYLWNQDKLKGYNIHKIVKEMPELIKVMKKIQKFKEPMSSATYIFKKYISNNINKKWINDKLVLIIPLKINITEKITSDIDYFIKGFLDYAADGYLEGDAVVYDRNGDEYELVFDDISMFVFENGKVTNKKKYPKYWH